MGPQRWVDSQGNFLQLMHLYWDGFREKLSTVRLLADASDATVAHLLLPALQVLALYHAPFQEVILLDTDSLLLVTPRSLFEGAAYKQHDTHFWPDLWYNRSPDVSRMLALAPPGAATTNGERSSHHVHTSRPVM